MTLEQNPHGFPNVPKDAYVCNRSRPMPTNRDQVGHQWYHVDAKPENDDETPFGSKRASPCIWHCVNCNHSWSGLRDISTDPDYRAPPAPAMRHLYVEDVASQAPHRVTYGFTTGADLQRFSSMVAKMVGPAPAKVGKRPIVMQGSSQSSPNSHWVKYRFQSRADRDEFVNRVNMDDRYTRTIGVTKPAPTNEQVDALRAMIMNVSAVKWATSTTAASNVRVRNMLEAIWRMNE